MKKLLMRADDLGYSEGVNYGIAKSVREGIIENVGVMTNMSTVIHGLNLLGDTEVCLGLHTNICAGNPLTDPSCIPSITNNNGAFKSSSEYRLAQEDCVVLEEAILEMEAQLKRFIDLVGKRPCYMDVHAIASDNFLMAAEIVAKKHSITYSPFSIGEGKIKIKDTDVYVSMDSMKTDYVPFSSLKRSVQDVPEDGCILFVCHPGYLDGYILNHSSLTIPRPLEVDMLCDPQTLKWVKDTGIELITYEDL
jgi:chitin disaccharide deacetylase